MKLFQTIRARLFLYYASIIVLLVTLFTSYFYLYTSVMLEKRASESLQQIAINTNQYLDAEFKNMNSVANRIISSEPIKAIYYDKTAVESKFFENQLKMFQLLFTVTGSSINYQINLVGTDGSFTEFGRKFDIGRRSPELISGLPWIQECLMLDGRFSISPPRINEWNSQGKRVISLSRAFSEVLGAKYDSIVEVQENYSVFSEMIENAVSLPGSNSKTGIKAYVYDGKGNQVYPFPGEYPPSIDYFRSIDVTEKNYGTCPISNDKTQEIIAFSRSEYSGWTVVVSESEKQLLAPVRSFRNGIFLLGLLVLVITLAITYAIAQQLTEPIRSIQHSINKLNLEDLNPAEPASDKSSTYELNKLNQAYVQMVNRLQASLEETVTAKSQEIQARMLALQAQVNPHFLYNTITIISIKAEKNNETEIVEMCENLTTMLRYIAKETSSAVTIDVELDYLQKYLSLMESRYPNQFRVQINLPDELKKVCVPKLIIQPIIENCFKYAFNIRAPWLIDIKGTISENYWTISVADNGIGFDDEVLQTIKCKINAETFEFASDEKDKIGLLNIYYRLKLQYKDQALFTIANKPEGGSVVTIGGFIKEEGHNEW